MRLKKNPQTAVNGNMRAVKYSIVLWIFMVVYAGMSFFAGPKGISAYNDLLDEQNRQEKNLQDLERINAELENTRNALLYDRDTIRVYARDLGFGEKGENFVRIVGLGQSQKVPLFPGEIVEAEERRSLGVRTICLVAAFAALAVFIAFLVQDMLDLKLEGEDKTPRIDRPGVPGGSVPFQTVRRSVPRPLPPEPPLSSGV
jgi:cell division protein FtsB